MSEYVDVDIIENGKVIGTTKILKKTEEPEEQKIKLEKVDDKAAYRNLLIKYAELEKENAELKAKNKWYSEQVCNKECAEVWGNLTKAIELLKWALHSDPEHDNLADFDTKWKQAEQFLKEIEK